MALTRDEKEKIVSEVSELIDASKLTVVANYKGISVKEFQTLRRQARENGTKVKVIKNSLFIQALAGTERFKATDTSQLNEQLVYAFNDQDETSPAQALANFAKTTPALEFVGGITDEGEFIGASEVKVLAALPSKEQLRGVLAGTIKAPLSGFVKVVSGNMRGILNVLMARSQQI